MSISRAAFVAVAAVLAGGCYTGVPDGGPGAADDAAESTSADLPGGSDSDADDDSAPADDTVPRQGLRRLSAAEYDQTIRDLLGIEGLQAIELLPTDPRTPFDNDADQQIASDALINAADLLAQQAATAVLDDPTLRDALVGCAPQSPDDTECMRAFIERFGRRALRRPLDADEVELYLYGTSGNDGALAHAVADGDFDTGVELVLRTLLQEPEFLYRVEIGEPVEGTDGLYRLDDFEVATRLSYLLWGSTPDDDLLDLAAAGGLRTPDDVAATAMAMFEDPRAQARIERFHAMWLGWESMLVGGDLGAAMREESGALIRRIVFEDKRVWHDLFREEQTFVGDLLAEHYGLPAPGSDTPTWVDYGDSGRRGLLSHGTFLSIGAMPDDTSPVQRGLAIRQRLFCQEIGAPPPNVNVDEEPQTVDGYCKVDRYAAHRQGNCAACHQLMDPVGFGLENYDQLGRYRTHEVDDPATPEDESTCEIPGDGEIVGVGTFRGPAELADLALSSRLLDDCVATQLHRFVVGRGELAADDAKIVDAVLARLGEGDFRLDDLVLAIVGDPSFGYRREDVPPEPPEPSDSHPTLPHAGQEEP